MSGTNGTQEAPAPSRPPFCVFMVGLPGSGKTTLSRVLVGRGFVRLCPDEEMFRRHGVYGVDFPRGVFPDRERPVLADTAVELRKHLQAGRDVVVDHGFWTPEDGEKWRSIASEAGVTPLLVYLAVSHDDLWSRGSKRNEFHANDRTQSISLSLIPRDIARVSFHLRSRSRTFYTPVIPRLLSAS